MEWVPIRILDFFDDEDKEVYGVVDRVDRCHSRHGERVDHRKALPKVLVKMVEAARCKLKVMAVIDGSSWRVESGRDELGEKRKERVVVYTAEQGLV